MYYSSILEKYQSGDSDRISHREYLQILSGIYDHNCLGWATRYILNRFQVAQTESRLVYPHGGVSEAELSGATDTIWGNHRCDFSAIGRTVGRLIFFEPPIDFYRSAFVSLPGGITVAPNRSVSIS